MGTFFSRQYTIHARRRSTDRYDPKSTLAIDMADPGLSHCEALGVFKREAYAMALCRAHEHHKAIYLYHGNSRVGRAGYGVGAPGTFEVTLASAEDAQAFDVASERLGPDRWPLLERAFYRAFRSHVVGSDGPEPHPCTRVFHPVATGVVSSADKAV